ncbi:MAG: hypothetical protein WDO14_13425 [Bacteroidota bacterium]
MKRFIFLSLLLVATAGYCQQTNNFSFEHWHKGYLILEGGDTLRGQIKYNMQADLVQFQNQSQVETFTARKVVFMEIFDSVTREYRRFFSLPYALQGGYKSPVFFELLTEGKMTLLSRENLEYRTYSSFYYYGSYTRLVMVYRYYLLEENGEIKEFVGKKNDWIYAMGNKGEDVQKYARSNKLNFDAKPDLQKIVEYYNSLFQ